MSEKPLSEIDLEKAVDAKVIDNHTGEFVSGYIIGAERNGGEVIIWIDSGIQ